MIKDRDIGYILHKAAMQSKNHLTNRLSTIGITPGQFVVMKEIYLHQETISDNGLSPASIADRLEYDRPTISGIIDRLEAQGWVERLQNPEDKRSYLMRVTNKAVNTIRELDIHYAENNKIVLNGFTDAEAILLKDYLLRIINNFKE